MTAPPPGDLDLLVLGSGVAGLSAAVRAADHGMRVGVLTKGELPQATTRWAQGGVAAVLRDDPDSTDLHLADTLACGAGLCDTEAVRVLVDEGPDRVLELIALGAAFDRDPDGTLQLAREGGHSQPRVVHAGGAATGAEVERALVVAVQRAATALHEHHFAVDLVVEGGRCRGVTALAPDGTPVVIRAANVLVTTGGAGQLFAVTTNPVEATGDGIAMALRAGVAVADVEFIQFHPTALHHEAMPRPLLSEALRGHGARLRDGRGERFVDELQPRDVVSRAELEVMVAQGIDHVFLDARELEDFGARFPTIDAALRVAGLDPSVDLLPVAPAAHYTCGGMVTDLDGATSLPGLWAAGEASCTGVHGANRLASNSLLEGMVFGPRAVEAIERGQVGAGATGAMRAVLGGDRDGGPVGPGTIGGHLLARPTPPAPGPGPTPSDPEAWARVREGLQRAMSTGAGVVRDAATLAEAGVVADGAAAAVATTGATDGPAVPVAAYEVANLAEVARALVRAATAREESRGAHARRDFPTTSPALRHRFVVA
ncbi:FAD-dependent oxidoreductase [Iamia majanohamensis]|uniref:L-aspartate oxidase n=1 Tax=Iamia majanohamensis TaxID=467976 RepID=A0AAF0BT80_9ACTN|nr:FAD-dependent oxidoreductase [Iamia majanohamensis]WCO66457.1 FAD-dependent oxidoreductase [Iamia majanohamensis]